MGMFLNTRAPYEAYKEIAGLLNQQFPHKVNPGKEPPHNATALSR